MRIYVLPILFLLLFVASCHNDTPKIYVPVTGVRVNKDVVWLEEGKQAKLEAVVYPDSASNKRVQWKSSDESVVKVDNKGNITATGGGEAEIIVTTQDNAWKSSSTCYVKAENKGGRRFRRTVLVYFAADNTLEKFAAEDWAEITNGMKALQDEDVRLLAYIDTGKNPRLVVLGYKDGKICMSVEKLYESRNSVGVAETKEVFDYVFSSYPADSYGLVYWSHGEGWVPKPLPSTRWIGQDTGDGTHYMNIDGLVSVLEGAPHFDFIMFDACFMQSVEVAYELREYTDYYIGSPAENPGPGAPYDKIMPYLFQKGAATKIASEYFAVYEAKYDEGRGISNTNWTGGTAICVLKTGELENLAAATRAALTRVEADGAKLRGQIFDCDRRDGHSSLYVGYFDFVEMMEMLVDDVSALNDWRQAFNAALGYWASTPKIFTAVTQSMFSMERSHGVTHYIPSPEEKPKEAKAYRSMAWYLAAGLDEVGW